MLGNSTNIFADEVDEDYVAEIAREEIEIVEMEVSNLEKRKKWNLNNSRSIARRTANDARCSSSAPWRPVVSCCSSSPS